MTVTYPYRSQPKTDMPAPRLQLCWRKPTEAELEAEEDGFGADWVCQYELVVPLGKYDIRAERHDDGEGEEVFGANPEFVVTMGLSRRSGGGEPCKHDPCDTPYRAGAHAKWDAAALGNLPVYVIAPNGSFALVQERPA